MFDYLCGTLVDAKPDKAILDVSGVGYKILISMNTYQKLSNSGKEAKLFVSFVVREDSQRLFGFTTVQERDTFESLTQISGIGPKIGLSLLGHLTLEDLYAAVEGGNAKAIAKVPGIGKKTAERLLIELKDRVANATPSESGTSEKGLLSDATNALINLGYHPIAAQRAVRHTLSQAPNKQGLSEVISISLKNL